MIKAVFFDLDGTVRQNLPSGGEVFANRAAELGLQVGREDRERLARWEHFYWAMSREFLADRQRFDGRVSEFWYQYGQRQLVALGATTEQALELAPQMTVYMLNNYKPTSVVPDDVRRLLSRLKESGYRMALISNREKDFREEVEALGLAPFMEFSLAGGEINAYKPEPEIFLHACSRLGVTPAESAYVGDSYFADVVGARRARLTPILYDPRGIFPDAGCTIIQSFDELPAALAPGSRSEGGVALAPPAG